MARHQWQEISKGKAFCKKCGLVREATRIDRGFMYTPPEGTAAIRNYAGDCSGYHAHITEGAAFGLHKCPRGGECYCITDNAECVLKAACTAEQPIQLKLF